MVKWCSALLRVLLVCISSYAKLVLRYTFLILDTQILTLSVYVSKDVRIRDYFSKPKGIREQISLGITGVDACRATNGGDIAVLQGMYENFVW
jgi:hypothetical protein